LIWQRIILNSPEYRKIRKKQVQEWNEIYSYAKDVLSPDFPKRTLFDALKWEKKLKKYNVEL